MTWPRLEWRLAAVFLLQAVALVYIVADRQWLLANGTPIVLETLPVDPRSLFSGDYVRLNYRISRLSMDKVEWGTAESAEGRPQLRPHDSVYVRLRHGDPYAEAMSIYPRLPNSEAPGEYVMLRGEVVSAVGE